MDAECPDRPSTAVTPKTVAVVEKMIKEEPSSNSIIKPIVSRWVQYTLTAEQMETRVKIKIHTEIVKEGWLSDHL